MSLPASLFSPFDSSFMTNKYFDSFTQQKKIFGFAESCCFKILDLEKYPGCHISHDESLKLTHHVSIRSIKTEMSFNLLIFNISIPLET